MKIILQFALLLALAYPAFAQVPVCLYQDVQSGPAIGGEGGNGIYMNIYGYNFGASQGSSTVTVNGHAVAQYLAWGADPTGERQQIGVQIASGTTTGAITVTTSGGSCANLSFTVRSGNTYFIGPAVDNSTPANCATMEAANSYSAPWGLTNFASTNESLYNPSTMRTPFTYYNCLSPGDTLVFLNGVNYPYYDGYGFHASLTITNASVTSTTPIAIMARPGATATLGGTGWAQFSIRNTGASSYTVYSGITMIGSGSGGASMHPDTADRYVGNTIECPTCDGADGATNGANGVEALGNLITLISTSVTNGSDKEYHAAYFEGNNFEFAWNRISNTAAYNGIQVNLDSSSGFYNFAIHDNDIADVNGSGVNLSTIDPASGYIQIYNNVLHHNGVNLASDGGNDDPHSCIAVKGFGSAAGTGTVAIYNNTMFDCSSILNISEAASGDNASCAVYLPPNQLNVTTNLVNNATYQPAYTYTSQYNVYICNGSSTGSPGTFSGSNNLWYSATTPGSTAYATTIGSITNPLFVSATNGSWTNYALQSGSPAIGAGIRVGPVESPIGTSNTYLTWDFAQAPRPNPPAIGFLEYGSIAPPTFVGVQFSSGISISSGVSIQ